MTNIEDELTIALRRRADTVAVEDHLVDILDDVNVIRFTDASRAHQPRLRLLNIAAAVAVLTGAGGLIWVNNTRTPDPAASSAPGTPVDTGMARPSTTIPTHSADTIIPAEFPDDVPRPDTFALMNIITWDGASVGWEFYEQTAPTESVDRCTQYAASFDPNWTALTVTDEAASVSYAQSMSNSDWQVGIYCINDGGFLVQVMPEATTEPIVAIQVARHTDPDHFEFSTEVAYRTSMFTEPLTALGYTIAAIDTQPDAPATVRAESTTDRRTIAIKMTAGNLLQPENHNRVPMTVVEKDDLQIRGQVNSNSGWTFEITAERTATDGPLPSPAELQELLYALDP